MYDLRVALRPGEGGRLTQNSLINQVKYLVVRSYLRCTESVGMTGRSLPVSLNPNNASENFSELLFTFSMFSFAFSGTTQYGFSLLL